MRLFKTISNALTRARSASPSAYGSLSSKMRKFGQRPQETPVKISLEYRSQGHHFKSRAPTDLVPGDLAESVGVDVRVEEAVAALESAELLAQDAGERGAEHAAPHVRLGDAAHVQVNVVHARVHLLRWQERSIESGTE